MKCPECGSEEIRTAECLELVCGLGEEGEPGELINGHEIFDPPCVCYYLCAECDHRWDLDGTALMVPAAVPARS